MTRGRVSPRLVYFDRWVDGVAEEVLRDSGEVDLVRLHADAALDSNWAAFADAHGYHVQPRTELRPPWFGDASLLSRSPQLLALCSTGAGYDYIDVDACTAAGVIVCHQGGTNKEAVAEHALGLMLALSKRIMIADRTLRNGSPGDRFTLQGSDIAGKTLGIIGLGAIGTRVAELCAGLFNMQVLAYDPYVDTATARTRHANKVGLPELLRRSDFVSVHCPRTPETFGMMGEEQFALMRRQAYFITTARGGVHDEQALARAVAHKRIAGAGVDVFLSEPPAPDHPLLELDSVIATPHTAGITNESLHSMALEAANQWLTIFSGQVPPRLVNPEVWPMYARRFFEAFGFWPGK